MLERLGLVLPVSPPSLAAVAVVVLESVEVVAVDDEDEVVSSLESMLERSWLRLLGPCELMPAMDMIDLL
jgi:hypothetical protein